MKMTRNERNVLARLLGGAVKVKYPELRYVTVEKLRYVDDNTFCFVARLVTSDGSSFKRVLLSTDVWSPELEFFCQKRDIRVQHWYTT